MTVSTDIHERSAVAMKGKKSSGRGKKSATEVLLSLVPHVINPIQLAIVEALAWIDRPLSATQLAHALEGVEGDRRTYVGLISYHLRVLADFQVLEVARKRSVRGSTETFFVFRTED